MTLAGSEKPALTLLYDIFDEISEESDCSRCSGRMDICRVHGDSGFAVGLVACTECGTTGDEYIADPDGRFTSDEQCREWYEDILYWTPPWAVPSEDISDDWVCACGKTWPTLEKGMDHAEEEHPKRTGFTTCWHDRNPYF